MSPIMKGVSVAVLHCLIVLSLAGKYAVERENLPRAWVKTVPFDPDMPIRGRYVNIRIEVDVPNTAGESDQRWQPARLSVENGHAVATLVSIGTRDTIMLSSVNAGKGIVAEPLAFFIPEHAEDPSRRLSGEELWVEVSVPPSGAPRPVRLGVKRDGILTPLNLQ